MDNWDGPPFLKALALTPKSRVLEIGVGAGRLAKKVLEAGCAHFTGIDISHATIKRAQENLHSWNNLSLLQGDFLRYPFTQTFDVAYCSLTLFHFQDKRAFTQKAAALLPQGRLVLSIPKEKETTLPFGSREIPLYPDDLNTLQPCSQQPDFPYTLQSKSHSHIS